MQLYVASKVCTEYSPIQKLVLVPFTVLALGDFACLGKILGASICYFEGYSSDDYHLKTEFKSNEDGSYSAKSKFTLVPTNASNGQRTAKGIEVESTPSITQLTITNIINPPISAWETDFKNAVRSGLVQDANSFEKLFHDPITKTQAHELIKIYHQTGITLSSHACLTFLETLRSVDKQLALQWEREILFEMDFAEQMIKSWSDCHVLSSSLMPRTRDITHCSRLDRKRRKRK